MANGEEKVTSFTWTAGNIKHLYEGRKDSLKSPEFSTEKTLTKPKTAEKVCFEMDSVSEKSYRKGRTGIWSTFS